MPSRDTPASTLVPSLMVTGRSVFSRSVTHGTPSAVVLSCTPPESVRTNAASFVVFSISTYDSGSSTRMPSAGARPKPSMRGACAGASAGGSASAPRSRRVLRGRRRARAGRPRSTDGATCRARTSARSHAEAPGDLGSRPQSRASGAASRSSDCRRSGSSPPGSPPTRFSSASRHVVSSRSEIAPRRGEGSPRTRCRGLRSPASTCTSSGRRRAAAPRAAGRGAQSTLLVTSAHAAVEFTSPTTTTTSGRRSASTRSKPPSSRARSAPRATRIRPRG